MSNLKKVKNIAQKAYKKVPKKKLVNKAATYGLKQVIGGPYLDIFNIFYKKSKKKVFSYAGSYAYTSLLRSKFARDKINALPMSIVATVVRTIVNFLIFSRLITGIKLFDFLLSMIVTIVITLMAPFFYTSIKAHEDMFLLHTNNFIDRFMGPGGWEYVETLKNRILLLIGIFLLIILQFVKINSRYLQEIIVHALITGFITDIIQRWIDIIPRVRQLHFGMTRIESEEHQLTFANYANQDCKRVNRCHTDNLIVIGGPKTSRATLVPYDKLKEYIMIDMDLPELPKLSGIDNSNVPSTYVNIIDDYNSNTITSDRFERIDK